MTITADNLKTLGLPTGATTRDLDGLIAVAFDGYWTRTPAPGVVEYCFRDPGGVIRWHGLAKLPDYSTSLPDAIAVLERAYPGIWWIIGKGKMTADEPEYGCQLQFGTNTVATAEADTAAMAVIAAMIIALPDGTMNEARRAVAEFFADKPEQEA